MKKILAFLLFIVEPILVWVEHKMEPLMNSKESSYQITGKSKKTELLSTINKLLTESAS